ncbi:coiled-coil domain-containing protein 172 [Macrochelys suwanniensis]
MNFGDDKDDILLSCTYKVKDSMFAFMKVGSQPALVENSAADFGIRGNILQIMLQGCEDWCVPSTTYPERLTPAEAWQLVLVLPEAVDFRELTDSKHRKGSFGPRAVKLDINRSHEKIKQIMEELNEAKIKLETKVQQLSEKLFCLQLLKKREDILKKKKVELMNQRSIFVKIFSDTKRKMIEEEENFIKEITDFNNEYGLTCNRELLIRKKAKTEICDLETKANILKNEMESMERENVQLNALQLQKNELKQDLFTLQSKLKDTEEQLRDAEDITKCLEAEKVKVSEKPQTDIECLRIKKELEIYKEDDLENVCEALQTEIEFLQMKLSQTSSGK